MRTHSLCTHARSQNTHVETPTNVSKHTHAHVRTHTHAHFYTYTNSHMQAHVRTYLEVSNIRSSVERTPLMLCEGRRHCDHTILYHLIVY